MRRGLFAARTAARWVLAIGLFIGWTAQGAVLFDESAVAVKAGARVIVPDELKFTIAQQDTYRLTLTNVGPAAAQNPKLIVTRGIVVAARVDSATAPQNVVDAVLTPGDYVLRISGRAPAGLA